MTQEKILKELEKISATKLTGLGLEQKACENPTMKLAGAWADMRDDLFESLMNEIEARRSRAFSGNQD